MKVNIINETETHKSTGDISSKQSLKIKSILHNHPLFSAPILQIIAPYYYNGRLVRLPTKKQSIFITTHTLQKIAPFFSQQPIIIWTNYPCPSIYLYGQRIEKNDDNHNNGVLSMFLYVTQKKWNKGRCYTLLRFCITHKWNIFKLLV